MELSPRVYASVLACSLALALACSERSEPAGAREATPSPEPGAVHQADDAPEPPPPPALPAPSLPIFVLAKLAHDGAVSDVAWSRDGSRIATTSADGKLRIWDARAYTLVQTFDGWPEPPRHVALSRDGTLAVGHAADEARILDTTTGKLRASLTHAAPTTAVAISPDGERVSTASDDEVRVWTPDGESLHMLEQRDKPVLSLASGTDGELLSGWGDGKIRRIDLVKGRFVGKPIATQGKLERLAHDGGRVLVDHVDGPYDLFDVQTGERLATGSLPTPLALGVGGHLVLATGPADERGPLIVVIDGMSSSIARELIGHRGPITAAAWSPDGAWFVSGSEDHDALIWAAP